MDERLRHLRQVVSAQRALLDDLVRDHAVQRAEVQSTVARARRLAVVAGERWMATRQVGA